DSKHVVALAGNFCNLGDLILGVGQPRTALAWYEKAIARLEPVVAKEPQSILAREFLRNSHWSRAITFGLLGRHAEAARGWERALALDDGRAKGKIRLSLAMSHLQAFRIDKDAAGCLAASAEYEAVKPADAAGLYDA